jgi:hypothetical protein
VAIQLIHIAGCLLFGRPAECIESFFCRYKKIYSLEESELLSTCTTIELT